MKYVYIIDRYTDRLHDLLHHLDAECLEWIRHKNALDRSYLEDAALFLVHDEFTPEETFHFQAACVELHIPLVFYSGGYMGNQSVTDLTKDNVAWMRFPGVFDHFSEFMTFYTENQRIEPNILLYGSHWKTDLYINFRENVHNWLAWHPDTDAMLVEEVQELVPAGLLHHFTPPLNTEMEELLRHDMPAGARQKLMKLEKMIYEIIVQLA